ncbi:MAG: hypothetical protein WC683_02655 [bacterium]
MKYRRIGRWDDAKDKPVWGKGKATSENTVERASRARSGGVLAACKCGGELVVMGTEKQDVTCCCTKCGGFQYWEIVPEQKKAA